MASDVIGMRLLLRRIRALEVVEDTSAVLRVRVESTQTRVACPHCGFKCRKVHDTRERRVRDLEVSGRASTFLWMRRRFVCGNCGERFLGGPRRVRREVDTTVGASPGRGPPKTPHPTFTRRLIL
ncbi:MAG: transposase family protein [Acidimicrobiia bacterium]|nr:transposase family protein [Acidimicrobiia bacterium]